MSIDRTDYIIYGWKLPFDIKNENGDVIDLWEDKFLSMIEGHPGEEFTIIRDGMCCKYTVFGLRIDSSDDWDFVNLNILQQFDFRSIKNNRYNSDKVKDKYKELFGTDIETEPYLFIFTHYS